VARASQASPADAGDPVEDFIYDAKIPDDIERLTGQELLSRLGGQPPYPKLLMLSDMVAEKEPTRILTRSGIVLAFNRPGVEPPPLSPGAEVKAVCLYIGKGKLGPEEGRPLLDSCVLGP
jgi:hypothetical protein